MVKLLKRLLIKVELTNFWDQISKLHCAIKLKYSLLIFKLIILRILLLESHMVSKKIDDGADLYILAGHEASY